VAVADGHVHEVIRKTQGNIAVNPNRKVEAIYKNQNTED
jgi:hypothetical protein